MRTVAMGAVAVALGLAMACSDSVDGSNGCTDISGNYSVTATRASGTCDVALDPKSASTVTFTRAGEGWSVAMPGIEDGCPGELNASTCRFTSVCKLYAKATGATLATLSIDYTFDGPKLSGSSVSGLVPPAVAQNCDVTYRETGTKL